MPIFCTLKVKALVVGIALLTACGRSDPPAVAPKVQAFGILAEAKISQAPHYTITSTATDEQTAKVANAVEALYRSYVDHFGSKGSGQKLELVLYKDQSQFRKYNRSSPWAEAYYLKPRAYAYFSDGDNPYHWMLHEATHQLMRELSGFRPAKWADEGIASYFGSSTVRGSTLLLGNPDPRAYPIWWLHSLKLSGNLQNDIAAGRIIPLRQLITDTGPDINQNVNLYYMHYWSLTHFFFHSRDGRYSNQYKELAALGGTLEDFENKIGAIDTIQSEWYDHLVQQVSAASAGVPQPDLP